MIYFDTSAIVKLVLREPESMALRAWLDGRETYELVTSEISEVELVRTIARQQPRALATAQFALSLFTMASLTPAIRLRATVLSPPGLRTLDALHLATALETGNTDHFACYDKCLIEAANLAGLAVVSPN